jgi:hypothetical protein
VRWGGVENSEAVQDVFGAQLLGDPDRGVDCEDHAEQRVLVRADDDHHHE